MDELARLWLGAVDPEDGLGAAERALLAVEPWADAAGSEAARRAREALGRGQPACDGIARCESHWPKSEFLSLRESIAKGPSPPARWERGPAQAREGWLSSIGQAAGRLRAMVLEPWFEAAKSGDAAAVAGMLARGVDPNARDVSLSTAAVSAAAGGHLGVLSLLADAGADLGLSDGQGTTCAMWAAQAGDMEMLALILRHRPGAALDLDNNGRSPLHRAAEMGRVEAIEALARAGGPIEAADSCHGRAALLAAAARGQAEAVESLLRLGADHKAWDFHGDSAAKIFALAGHGAGAPAWDSPARLALIERLLEGGVAPERQLGRDGAHSRGASVCAVLARMRDVCALRLMLRADPSLVYARGSGLAPIHWAAQGVGGPCVIVELLAAGCPPDLRAQEDGSTALMWAARFGDVESFDALASAGADMEAKDGSGLGVDDWLAMDGREECRGPLARERALRDARELGGDLPPAEQARAPMRL